MPSSLSRREIEARDLLSASQGVTIVQLERTNAVVIGRLAGVLMGWLMGRPFDAPMTNGYASLVKATLWILAWGQLEPGLG